MTKSKMANCYSPEGRARAVPINVHDPDCYRHRHRINDMFARLRDWRRIATRCDKCADIFLSARALPAVVMFRV